MTRALLHARKAGAACSPCGAGWDFSNWMGCAAHALHGRGQQRVVARVECVSPGLDFSTVLKPEVTPADCPGSVGSIRPSKAATFLFDPAPNLQTRECEATRFQRLPLAFVLITELDPASLPSVEQVKDDSIQASPHFLSIAWCEICGGLLEHAPWCKRRPRNRSPIAVHVANESTRGDGTWIAGNVTPLNGVVS